MKASALLGKSLPFLCCGVSALALAGCATSATGSRGCAAFEHDSSLIQLSGTQAARPAAACFEKQARFLPLSEFSRDGTHFTYRLRVSDLWFEQVTIEPTTTGSRAEVRLAPDLDARWHGQFDADRLQPLLRCLER